MPFHPLLWLSKRLTDVALRISGRNGVEYAMRRAAETLGQFVTGCDGQLGYFFGDIRDEFVHRSYQNAGTWDPKIQRIFDQVFEKGGTLIDAGANIGLLSVPISKRRDVTVHAFEPDPQNFLFLCANAGANRASRVNAYNLALMASEGALEFERSRINWGDHRVRRAPGIEMDERQDAVIRVDGKRLDDVLAGVELRRPVLLKVDTQGADVQVLRGASAILDRVDFAVCEFWPYGLRRMGETCEAFYEAISPFPFGAIIGEEPLSLTPLADVVSKLRRLIPQDGSEPQRLVDVFLSKQIT